MKKRNTDIFKNGILIIICLFAPLIIIMPVSTFILDSLIILTASGVIIITISNFLIKRDGLLRLNYFIIIIKSVTVLFLFKEIVLRTDNTPLIIRNLIDLLPTLPGPFSWLYFVSLMFLFYYLVSRYLIKPEAELFSRFIIDAMPGMQMSIDSDLAHGVITEDEARSQRDRVRRKADLANSYKRMISILYYEGCIMFTLFILSTVALTFGDIQGGILLSSVKFGGITELSVVFVISLSLNITNGFFIINKVSTFI